MSDDALAGAPAAPEAAAGNSDQVYSGDGSTTYFQICRPGVTVTPSGRTLTCGGNPLSVPLSAADGIKVWLGNSIRFANGQWFDAPRRSASGVRIVTAGAGSRRRPG